MGPNLGLELVHSHESVAEIANLGLVFLLFMIGLLGYVFSFNRAFMVLWIFRFRYLLFYFYHMFTDGPVYELQII